MNIIVAHEGKQHVNHLLISLERQKWLKRFYVGFASNSVSPYLYRISKLDHWLKKKRFTGFDTARIRPLYVSTLASRFTTNPYWQIRIAFRLFDWWVASQLQRETNFELLIGYENCNLLSFRVAKRLCKTTVLDLAQIHHATIQAIQAQFHFSDLSAEQSRYIDHLKQQALEAADYILSLSSFATRSLTSNGIDRDRIYEVNLGIDTVHFCPDEKPGDGRFRLLFVGTITHRKGLTILLNVFQQLALPNAELILVGPESDAASLLASCTGNIRHIPFLHHDELVTYYQQADVFVFPSYLDSWGQVVLEAMACGTPVIVSDNTGAKDAVAKGGGFIIPTGDEVALREKIRYVYTHRDETKQMGREARHVAEQYTWENYYQQVTNALTDIARRKNIPR